MVSHIPLKVNFDIQAKGIFDEKIPILQPVECQNAELLIADAKKVEPLIKNIDLALIRKANEILLSEECEAIKTYQFELAETKGKTRILQKAEGEHENSYLDIRDVARSSINMFYNKQVAALCTVVDWAKEYNVELPHGARIVISDNRFKKPTGSGYSSHKANIAIPIPDEPGRWHIVETMIKHDDFEKEIQTNKKNRFDANSHEAYEKLRFLQTVGMRRVLTRPEAVLVGKMTSICRSIHNDARNRFNLDQIQPLIKEYSAVLAAETWSEMKKHLGDKEPAINDPQ